MLLSSSSQVGEKRAEQTVAKYTLHINSNPQINLSSDCGALLPKKPFDDDTFGQYETFFQECGTHYAEEVTVGCSINYRHYTGKIKSDKMTLAEVQKQSESHFLWLIKTMTGETADADITSKMYLDATLSTTNCRGNGMNCPEGNASFAIWRKSCPSQPTILGAKMRPISQLIHDQNVAAEVNKALNNTFLRAFLQDIIVPTSNKIIEAMNKFGINDDAGACVGDTTNNVCPDDWCGGRNKNCAIGTCGSKGPFLMPAGGDADMDALVAQINANQTLFNNNVLAGRNQAQHLLKKNIVIDNPAWFSMVIDFSQALSRVQAPIWTLKECGWKFTFGNCCGYMTQKKEDRLLRALHCECQPGTQRFYVQRTIKYLNL